MKSVLALDPGYATGIATGHFDDNTPLQLEDAIIVPYEMWPEVWLAMSEEHFDHVTSESFDLKDNDFKADLTPVKIEGTLDLLFGDQVVYRDRTLKSQVSDQLLKDIGWWKTGKDVMWEDGRDANDAIIHLLGYVAFNLKHRPTLREYFK